MACILHHPYLANSDDKEIVPFTDVTLGKVKKCCRFWKKTTWGKDLRIAKRFEQVVRRNTAHDGYHILFYNLFTNPNRIRKARAYYRSKSIVPKCKNAFPHKCIFCLSDSHLTLSRCSKHDLAAKFLAAAAEHKDQRLLELIVGEDLIYRKLMYHNKCYLRYTYNSSNAIMDTLPATVEAAFRDFVFNGITTVEQKGITCVPLSALGPLFIKTVADAEAYSAYHGKLGYLMANFMKYCPYPLFAAGKIGVKPIKNTNNSPEEGDTIWENIGEAVDFQDNGIEEGSIVFDAKENEDCQVSHRKIPYVLLSCGSKMAEERTCILHWKTTPSVEAVIPCTAYMYEKIKDYCRSWKWTQSVEDVAVAQRFMAALPEDLTKEVPQLSFHSNCYVRFTSKARLQRAKIKAKRSTNVPEPEVEPEVSFPNRCIFCLKDVRTLTRCRKPHVVAKIRAKAAELNDYELLAQIEGRDMIAEWAKYHDTCYSTYVNKYHASTVPEEEWPAMDEVAFRRFMKEEIRHYVKDGRTCVPMSAFTDLFNTTIKSSKYLKSELPLFELRKHCPFLRCSKEKDNLPPSPTSHFIASKLQKHQNTSSTCNQDRGQKHQNSSSTCNQDRGQKRQRNSDENSNHREMLHYAQSLHGKISQVFAESQEALPPLELLNFLAACIAGSQMSPDSFMRLPNDTRDKVTSIARNIMHLSAEGLDFGAEGLTLEQSQNCIRTSTAMAQSASPAESESLLETRQLSGIEAFADEWLAMYGLL